MQRQGEADRRTELKTLVVTKNILESAAFQKFQDLVNAGLIDEGGLGTDFATANQAFYDGEAAMYFQGS